MRVGIKRKIPNKIWMWKVLGGAGKAMAQALQD
jgi:hypothetical protein